MSYLYTNVKGYPVQAHSYSGGSEYADCPKKYDYSRRQGWKEKDGKSALLFGNALEAAIIYYHAKDLDLYEAVDEWKRLWLVHQNDEAIQFSAKDGDWGVMYKRGEEMLKLYAALLPTLPIQNPKFQINYKKELYPNTDYAGLQFTSFVDILSEVEWDHPSLPPVNRPENGQRQVIVDVKTASNPYPADPRLAGMDPQLRSYAWATGIETVSFLVFVKRGLDYEKGDVVTILESFHDNFPVGSEAIVLEAGSCVLTLVTPSDYEVFKKSSEGLKGKALKERIEKFSEAVGYKAEIKEVTKQRLQFLAAVIPAEDREETGEIIGQQAIQISEANQRNFFPKRPGVRFPNNHCTFCSYLGLCIKDDKMVEEKLIQIDGVQKPVERDWLEDI